MRLPFVQTDRQTDGRTDGRITVITTPQLYHVKQAMTKCTNNAGSQRRQLNRIMHRFHITSSFSNLYYNLKHFGLYIITVLLALCFGCVL